MQNSEWRISASGFTTINKNIMLNVKETGEERESAVEQLAAAVVQRRMVG